MVYRSFARSGKVKNQTPKVNPADKKKKLTGRAKKRKQYNKSKKTPKNPNRQMNPIESLNHVTGGKRNAHAVKWVGSEIFHPWKGERMEYNGKYDLRGRIPDPWDRRRGNTHVQDTRKNRFDVRKEQILRKAEKLP